MAARVRQAIKESGRTEEAVGFDAGISDGTLSRRLNAKSPFKIDELERIANAIDVAPESFFTQHGSIVGDDTDKAAAS